MLGTVVTVAQDGGCLDHLGKPPSTRRFVPKDVAFVSQRSARCSRPHRLKMEIAKGAVGRSRLLPREDEMATVAPQDSGDLFEYHFDPLARKAQAKAMARLVFLRA
jgi:hypothetical protein